MEMIIEFPGGSKVDAHFEPFTIHTDQLPDTSAPSPFALFLASVGTCAGYYVQEFCRLRAIPTEGMRIVQRTHSGPAGLVARIALEIELPAGFPEKYRDSIIRAAGLCTVKKHLEQPPVVEVSAIQAPAVHSPDASTIGSPAITHHHAEEIIMSSIKQTAKDALERGRVAAVRVGKVAKSAVVIGAKAGAAAAVTAGALAAEKQWKETSPEAAKKRQRVRAIAAIAGAAAVGAAGVAIASSRRKRKGQRGTS